MTISTEDLAARLECNKRTVQRDINVLQDIFPISREERDHGKRYWKLAHNTVGCRFDSGRWLWLGSRAVTAAAAKKASVHVPGRSVRDTPGLRCRRDTPGLRRRTVPARPAAPGPGWQSVSPRPARRPGRG
ncbi:MAG: HTH domain-containing protein [Phycisphaerae bacterium]|nr:HTH domain-containing protein [Phycisphaerae bacterium]